MNKASSVHASADHRPLIVHVIHHLCVGGLENGLVNLINHLPAERFRHAVVCVEEFSPFRERIQRADVEVLALYRSRIGVAGVRREIFRLCRGWRPAVVHARNTSGLDALLPARLAGVPCIVFSEHGLDVDNLDGRRFKPALLRRLHSPLVSRYVTVSMALQRFLVDRIGIRPGRIEQIYNGVDTETFSPALPLQDDWLPANFRGPDRVRIGSVGRIQPVKDQATLVRAFAAMVDRDAETRRRARLVLIGDGPLLADLRELVRTLGIADIAHLPGNSNAVPQVLRCLDVFVLPSLNEGISNTILEAMASALPILATAVGGNVELVDDGLTGRWFSPGDTAVLAGQLAGYVHDDVLRRRQGQAARDVAVARFSLQSMVGRYETLYERLCRLAPREAGADSG